MNELDNARMTWAARTPLDGTWPTQPHSPTTTGKIERFHRTLRIEFDTRQVFRTLVRAQQALEEWVTYYNTERPHQSLGDATPASRFQEAPARPRRLAMRAERTGEQWVCRTVARNGLVCVDYQQISVGKHSGGSPCDVLVSDTTLQFSVGNELLKTVARRRPGPVRKKHAEGTRALGFIQECRSGSVKDHPK